jgi:hypothetical protein
MNEWGRSVGWWYWLGIAGLLAAEAAGWREAGGWAVGLGTVQLAHYHWREGALDAFPVQVRLAYLGLLVAGLWPPLVLVHGIQLAGTGALLLAGYCPLARMLALAPWNRPVPLTGALVRRAILSPPRPGTILQALYGTGAAAR